MGLGLGLSRGDVLDRLGELRVTQSLLGVERGGHAGGGRLEEGIGMRTVSGHLGANATEVCSSRGNDDLELVVSPLANSLILGCELGTELGPTLLGLLAGVGGLLIEDVHSLLESLAGYLRVLLNLGSVGSNMLVGLVDPSIHLGLEGSHGTLLGSDLGGKVLGGLRLVGSDNLADLLRARNVRSVAHVGELGSSSELSLGATHRDIEVLLGFLGVGSHLGKEELLQLLTSSHVESEVTCHLGAHCSDIALASGFLGSNFLLDVIQVVRQAHAAVRSVGEDGAGLLHVSAVH